MGKMFGMMLPKGRNKLTLSQMNMAGMGTAMMKGLMKKKNVASLDEMYDVAAQLAVKIYACQMSMDLMGFRKEEMIDYPGAGSVRRGDMLSHAKESSSSSSSKRRTNGTAKQERRGGSTAQGQGEQQWQSTQSRRHSITRDWPARCPS